LSYSQCNNRCHLCNQKQKQGASFIYTAAVYLLCVLGRDAISEHSVTRRRWADTGAIFRVAGVEGRSGGVAAVILPAPSIAAKGKRASDAAEAVRVRILGGRCVGLFALVLGCVALTARSPVLFLAPLLATLVLEADGIGGLAGLVALLFSSVAISRRLFVLLPALTPFVRKALFVGFVIVLGLVALLFGGIALASYLAVIAGLLVQGHTHTALVGKADISCRGAWLVVLLALPFVIEAVLRLLLLHVRSRRNDSDRGAGAAWANPARGSSRLVLRGDTLPLLVGAAEYGLALEALLAVLVILIRVTFGLQSTAIQSATFSSAGKGKCDHNHSLHDWWLSIVW